MLSKELEKQLVAKYLMRGIAELDGIAVGQPTDVDDVFAASMRYVAKKEGLPPAEHVAKGSDTLARIWKQMLAEGSTVVFDDFMIDTECFLKQKHGIRLSDAERNALTLKLLNVDKQVQEAKSALYHGEWTPMELLKEKVAKDLASPYFDLATTLSRYEENYLCAKPHVSEGSKKDMAVECRMLLEVFGNISITEFNTMSSVTKLEQILLNYPKNKVKRFGKKSIHLTLKDNHLYERISLKTANHYIDRAKSVVQYGNKCRMLNAANVYEGERFQLNTAAEEERPAYEATDIERLIDAICTQPLWTKKPPCPERFWIILIILFHGFRLGNITALTKKDICQTDKGTWIFQLRTGKTKATIRPVAICDSLLLLGFLEWVQKLPRNRLFQDSSKSFSVWYNRNEVQKNGKPSLGFECRHVTTEKGKCLYSLRHNFGVKVFDVTEDYKITQDMMGHSTRNSVTARYTKRTKAETLKEITEKMQLEFIDLDRLEARAIELFDQ